MNRETPAAAPAADSTAAVCWTATLMLGASLALTQLLAMAAIALARPALGLVAPAGLVAALVLGARLAAWSGYGRRERVRAAALTLAIIAAGHSISAWYFDLSVDGQWYHQTAIFALARDWNPLAEPMRAFIDHLQLWVTHYAKGPWYVSAAILATTGEVECGKVQAIMGWAAMFLAVLAAALDFGVARRRSVALAGVAALNPVVTSVLTAFLIEAILGSFFTVMVVAVMALLHRARPVIVAAAVAAAVVTINAKLTGLVFACIVTAVGFLWCVVRRRQLAWRFAAGSGAVLVLAAGLWGYNPYVTNLIFRGHPFYPVLGTKQYPSLAAQGREGIERYETPKNLLPLNRVARLGFALFGRPGNAPYIGVKNAEMMWPFGARLEDLRWYHYHETRVAGFGPYYGGALLLALALGLALAWRQPEARAPLALLTAAVVGSLMLSQHSWWARYSPQTWYLALVPAALAFRWARSPALARTAWVLTALLLVDGAIVAGVRTAWETRSTLVLRGQLEELRAAGRPVEIYVAWYPDSVPERLKSRGIRFVLRDRKAMAGATEMKSIVEGYPDFLAVRYRTPPAEAPAGG